MSRNGSGVYSLPEAAFTFETVISETAMNSNLSDIAAAMTASIAANGETTVSANLPMNSKKLTGLAVGSAAGDSASLGQVQAQAFVWCGVATGTADAVVLTPSPAITAYAAGQHFRWVASASVNTGAATVAISGLTTKALQNDGAALVAGDHAASKMYEGVYDGAAFQITRVAVAVPLSGGTMTGALDQDVNYSLRGQKLQSFVLRIRNNAGTLEHATYYDVSNNTEGAFSAEINNATATLTTSPTGADASTAMANGGKIGTNVAYDFILDTDALTATAFVALASVAENSSATRLTVAAVLASVDVNGTTRNRLHLRFRDAASGAAFNLNTTNIASGKGIFVAVTCWLP